MAKLDQISVENYTDRDFEVRFDSEVYHLEAGEKRTENQFLARHMAKHLSDREMEIIYAKEEAKYKKKKEEVPTGMKTRICQYDNPARRIALYKILRSKKQVEQVLTDYPNFGAKLRMNKPTEFACVGGIGVGDEQDYHDFVEDLERPKKEPETPKKGKS